MKRKDTEFYEAHHPAMTKREALKHARKLWGPKAGIWTRPPHSHTRIWDGKHQVTSGTFACNDGKGKVHIHGNGDTWEAAFADAKRRYKYWELEGK